MNKLAIFSILTFIFSFTSCEKLFIQPSIENTNTGIFDYVWQYTKHHYCCFDMQQIDWDDVYQTYSYQVNDDITKDSLLTVLHEMLSTLKDEDVALVGEFGELNYQTDNSMYPVNLDTSVVNNFYTAEGYSYNVFPGQIAYMNTFPKDETWDLLWKFGNRVNGYTGLIMDFRNWNVNKHKVEKPESDDTPFYDNEAPLYNVIKLTPNRIIGSYRSKSGDADDAYTTTKWRITGGTLVRNLPIVGLCNRATYSGSNRTVYALSQMPDVTIIGDRTGGGNVGIRSTGLPNGWFLKLPKGTVFDTDGIPINQGIDPNIFINDDPTTPDKDEIIEKALELLN